MRKAINGKKVTRIQNDMMVFSHESASLPRFGGEKRKGKNGHKRNHVPMTQPIVSMETFEIEMDPEDNLTPNELPCRFTFGCISPLKDKPIFTSKNSPPFLEVNTEDLPTKLSNRESETPQDIQNGKDVVEKCSQVKKMSENMSSISPIAKKVESSFKMLGFKNQRELIFSENSTEREEVAMTLKNIREIAKEELSHLETAIISIEGTIKNTQKQNEWIEERTKSVKGEIALCFDEIIKVLDEKRQEALRNLDLIVKEHQRNLEDVEGILKGRVEEVEKSKKFFEEFESTLKQKERHLKDEETISSVFSGREKAHQSIQSVLTLSRSTEASCQSQKDQFTFGASRILQKTQKNCETIGESIQRVFKKGAICENHHFSSSNEPREREHPLLSKKEEPCKRRPELNLKIPKDSEAQEETKQGSAAPFQNFRTKKQSQTGRFGGESEGDLSQRLSEREKEKEGKPKATKEKSKFLNFSIESGEHFGTEFHFKENLMKTEKESIMTESQNQTKRKLNEDLIGFRLGNQETLGKGNKSKRETPNCMDDLMAAMKQKENSLKFKRDFQTISREAVESAELLKTLNSKTKKRLDGKVVNQSKERETLEVDKLRKERQKLIESAFLAHNSPKPANHVLIDSVVAAQFGSFNSFHSRLSNLSSSSSFSRGQMRNEGCCLLSRDASSISLSRQMEIYRSIKTNK